jgi:ribose transport system permease protein
MRLASVLRAALPALVFILLLGAIFLQQPRSMSYFGVNLLLSLALPVLLASMSQMLLMAIGDLDLSIGSFVSLVTCIAAVIVPANPVLGTACLIGLIVLYGLVGLLIAWRDLPSVVVTLGLSFVWLGLAVILLPTPGGTAPAWLVTLMHTKPPVAPLAIWAAILVAALMQIAIMRTAIGTVVRGLGGNPRAVARSGWNLLALRVGVYAAAGAFGVLAGLALLGTTTSGDANLASRYTLLTIAAVILGGGEFVGGRVSPFGAVLGALTLALATSLLTFLHVPSDWQVGAQGLILIAVLALQAGIALISRDRGAAA